MPPLPSPVWMLNQIVRSVPEIYGNYISLIFDEACGKHMKFFSDCSLIKTSDFYADISLELFGQVSTRCISVNIIFQMRLQLTL